jgi:hypothetical protein
MPAGGPDRPAGAIRIGNEATEYRAFFDRALNAVSGGFTVDYANLFDGRIETLPAVGKLPTGAAVRRRAVVQIIASEQGGYLVEVRVFKEVEGEGGWAPAGRDEELEQKLRGRLTGPSPGPRRGS